MGKQMGWSKIRYTNDKVPKYRAWNPCGFGCTGCSLKGNGCWSERVSWRLGDTACAKCRAFEVHLHPERLSQPADTKTPSVVLANFTNDWLDPRREPRDIAQMLGVIARADHHVFVTLTKNATDAARTSQCRHEYRGLTIRHQEDADMKLPAFLQIPGQIWLSLEPLWGAVKIWDCGGWGDEAAAWWGKDAPLSGVIVGHDNRRNAPGTDTLDHVRSVVRQCEAAGVPVYVKQLWQRWCVKGQHAWDRCPHLSVDGKRSWNMRLCHDPADFPEDLRRRDLPWSMPPHNHNPSAPRLARHTERNPTSCL